MDDMGRPGKTREEQGRAGERTGSLGEAHESVARAVESRGPEERTDRGISIRFNKYDPHSATRTSKRGRCASQSEDAMQDVVRRHGTGPVVSESRAESKLDRRERQRCWHRN